MLKQLAFVLVAVVALTSLASAQENKQFQGNIPTVFTRMPCNTVENMLKTIAPYEEYLLFTGEGLTFNAQTGQPLVGGMMFFTNQTTGTWTTLQIFEDGMACLVMNGKLFRPYTGQLQVPTSAWNKTQ